MTYFYECDHNFIQLFKLFKRKEYNQAQVLIQTLNINRKKLLFNANSYTRHIIKTDENGWMGLLYWDKNASTPIHGHPDQLFMYILSGELSITNYQKDDLKNGTTQTLMANECDIHHGVVGKLDNAIHKVCTKQLSLSLHFYSDDPRNGELYI